MELYVHLYSILGKMGEGGKDCNFLVISVRKINQTTNQPNPYTSTNYIIIYLTMNYLSEGTIRPGKCIELYKKPRVPQGINQGKWEILG